MIGPIDIWTWTDNPGGAGPGPSGFSVALYKRHRIRLGQWYGTRRYIPVILLCGALLRRIFG
jgi:hypothetical protein